MYIYLFIDIYVYIYIGALAEGKQTVQRFIHLILGTLFFRRARYAHDDATLEQVYDEYENVDCLQEDVEAALRKLHFISDITDYGEDDVEVECDEPEFATMPMHYDMVQEILGRAERQARMAARGGNGCVKLPDVTETKVDWFMPVKPASNTFDNKVEAIQDRYDTETRKATFQTYYYNKETGKTSWTRRGAE